MRKTGVLAAVSLALLSIGASGAPTVGAKSHSASPVPRTAVVPNGAWTVYHHDDAHTGFDSTQPTASGATTGWVSATLDQAVYAEPLVFQGIVYVATLNNSGARYSPGQPRSALLTVNFEF